MTESLPERAPEHPDVPFDSPPGVHEAEPAGDDAPAPEADLTGEPVDDGRDDDDPPAAA